MIQKFDIAVIGSGPGGYRAAVLGALRGQRVAVVEKNDWGGCCLNRGCVPKKDWYHSARLVAASRGFARRGISGSLSVDLGQAWEHQETVVRTVQDSYQDYLRRLGVVLLSGTAGFVSANVLDIRSEAAPQRIQAEHVIVATGSKPRIPPGISPRSGQILTTDMLFDEPPPPGRRVAVLGGGLVGAEFAYILSMLGLKVYWISRRAPLARTRFSAQALAVLDEALRDCGMEILENAEMTGSEWRNGELVLTFSGKPELAVDWLLLGTGRDPVTDGLAPDAAGVRLDPRGFVRVNERLQTDAPNIYAIGDCVSEPMTANQAMADAAVAVENILAGDDVRMQRRRDELWVPEVIYSAVELARIGMNEDLAEDAGFEPAVGFAAFENSPQALGQDDIRGFVRLIADMDSAALLGAEVVGAEAGEIIHMLALAPDGSSALPLLARSWVNHPTRAEEFVHAAETLAGRWGLADRIFGVPAPDRRPRRAQK